MGGISVSLSTIFEVFCGNSLIILLATLLPMKSSVCSAVFWIALFEAVLDVSVADYLAWSRSFWLYLLLKLLLLFLPIFLPIFLAKDKNLNLLKIFNLLVELNSKSFLYSALYLITKLVFILRSISSASEFC